MWLPLNLEMNSNMVCVATLCPIAAHSRLSFPGQCGFSLILRRRQVQTRNGRMGLHVAPGR